MVPRMSVKREEEEMAEDKRYQTADGYPIFDGATLWNYYDLRLVTVRVTGDHADPESEFHSYWDGWFRCSRVEGGGFDLLNGERLSVYHPFTRERAPYVAELIKP